MLKFVWDREKAAANLAKHGVDFEDAITAFDDYQSRFSTQTTRRRKSASCS